VNSHAGFREYLCRFPRLLFYWVQFQWNKWFICLLRLFYFFLISNETFHYILKQKNETTYCFLCKQNLITQCFTISHVYSCQHNIIVKPEFWVFKIQRLYILKKERSVFALMFNLNAHTILKYLRFLILNRMFKWKPMAVKPESEHTKWFSPVFAKTWVFAFLLSPIQTNKTMSSRRKSALPVLCWTKLQHIDTHDSHLMNYTNLPCKGYVFITVYQLTVWLGVQEARDWLLSDFSEPWTFWHASTDNQTDW